jgi:glycolate oxidase FAD binding subunit
MPEAPDTVALIDALRMHLPSDAIETDAAAFAVGGLTPSVLVSPSSAEELARALAVANEIGAGIIPGSAGTQMHLGMPPSRFDIALYAGKLNRVIEYEPADLTVTVEAGLALADLQSLLSEHSQWLPLDPPVAPSATIGGILATNASGPARYRYGTARDLLIGLTFALPSGELAKSGGRVVKNVAGYDLGKLQIGALGTLGVITQATFKVAPLPAFVQLAGAGGSLTSLMSITKLVADALLAVQGIYLAKRTESSEWKLTVSFAGGNAAVERSLREFASLVRSSDAELTDAADAMPDGGEAAIAVRASVLPTSLITICDALVAVDASVMAYPAAGVAFGVWASAEAVRPPQIEYIRHLCADAGRGALVLERAPLELKQEIGVWGDPPASFDLMRRIKAELDPMGILNPGRYVGGI